MMPPNRGPARGARIPGAKLDMRSARRLLSYLGGRHTQIPKRQSVSFAMRTVYLLRWEQPEVQRLPARWARNLRKKEIFWSMRTWKQPFRDFMQQVTVRVDFSRWRKPFVMAHRQESMLENM